MAKSNAVRKQKKETKAAAKRGMSYKDLSILFLTEGLGKVEDALTAGKASATSAMQMVGHLQAKGVDTQLLAALVKRFAPTAVTPGVRGRRPPRDGETRSYKVQFLPGQSPFVRLPVPNAKKGQKMKVTFGPHVISVER